MFSITKLVRKLTGRLVTADMPPMGSPPAMSAPAGPAASAPAPGPATMAPPQQKAPMGMGSAWTQSMESAILSEMKTYLERNYRPGVDLEELEFNMNPLWKNRYFDLWQQAMRQFEVEHLHSTTEPSGPAVPKQVYKTLSPEVMRPKIEEEIHQTGKLRTPEELPDYIRENETNVDNYYNIAYEVLRQMEDQAAQKENQNRGMNPGGDTSGMQFQNKFAQVFYQMYLSPETPNNEQFHSLFQGKDQGMYGMQNGSDIAAIDSLFENRIPGGHASGKQYDPIIGYFVSDLGRQNAGMFIKAFRKATGQASGPIDRPMLARWIAQNGMGKAEEKFTELMYLQDDSVAKYIANKTRMKGEGAARSSGMIDRETGGVRDMDQSQGVSQMNNAVEDKPVNQGAMDALRQGLLDIPNHVERLGGLLKEELARQLQSNSGLSAKDQSNMRLNSQLIDAYTSAMKQSLEEMYQRAQNGQLSQNEISEMVSQGLIKVPTTQGVVQIVPNMTQKGDDILKHIDFSSLVQPSKFLPIFTQNLIQKTNPADAASLLGTAGKPVDLRAIDPKSPNFDKAQFDGAKKRMFMMPQFLLRDVGPKVLELLQQGQIDRSTALGFLRMLKPHGQSAAMGYMTSREGLTQAREWIGSQLPRIQQQAVMNADPNTGKQKKEMRPVMDGDGQPVYENTDSWMAKSMAKKEIPAMTKQQLDSMSDDQLRQWMATVAKKYYSDKSVMDSSKRQTAYYFAKLLDYGNKDSDLPADYQGYNTRMTSAAYEILNNAVIKMSSLLDLKSRLSKYASTDHIEDMMTGLRNDVLNRIKVLYGR